MCRKQETCLNSAIRWKRARNTRGALKEIGGKVPARAHVSTSDEMWQPSLSVTDRKSDFIAAPERHVRR
ncbi:hypothetical protein J6590_002030 [Homalodisca vitripennis]|nr:hypothetical protein J6590_002030 [Homalodisca vitripennis]